MADAATLRARVLADPNTARIAADLGVPLDEYVEQVVHYALNPTEDPEMVAADDEDLAAVGFSVPDEDAMGQYLVDAVATADAAHGDGFRASTPGAVNLGATQGAGSDRAADPALAADLKKHLRGTGTKG